MLPSPQLQDLSESRVQLHYAIQLIAATGAALATPNPDYSHTSLDWNPDLKLLVGNRITADNPFQVALEPIQLISLVLDQDGTKIAELPLHQKTLAEGITWLQSEIAKRGADAAKVMLLNYPPDDFPDHAIAHGATFDSSGEEPRKILVRYYDITHALLQEIVTSTEGASPVHIWPHHFDMATLITLPGTQQDEAMSIGMGFSPGDLSYNEPYWYVSPYPYPDVNNLPALEGHGFWHTSHWVGAVLTASRFEPEAGEGRSQIQQFLVSALKASQDYLLS
jgi:hypothetical protein